MYRFENLWSKITVVERDKYFMGEEYECHTFKFCIKSQLLQFLLWKFFANAWKVAGWPLALRWPGMGFACRCRTAPSPERCSPSRRPPLRRQNNFSDFTVARAAWRAPPATFQAVAKNLKRLREWQISAKSTRSSAKKHIANVLFSNVKKNYTIAILKETIPTNVMWLNTTLGPRL